MRTTPRQLGLGLGLGRGVGVGVVRGLRLRLRFLLRFRFRLGRVPRARVSALAPAFVLAGLLAAAPAAAQAPPGSAPRGAPVPSDRVQTAAAEYDEGRRAFMEQKFEEAAVHFENAWHDAPRAEALRNAIRARTSAKQLARAATLAAFGEHLYADDAATMALVRSTLDESAPQLHAVTLVCEPECGVAVDGRAVTLESGKRFTFFVEPGAHEAVVSWSEARSKALAIRGSAGSSEALSVAAPPLPPRPPPRDERPLLPAAAKPVGPVVFFIGAGLTAAGIAATIISGVDAKQNPGEDAVRRDCVGLGESCETYQKGRDVQLRTNILLGTTIGFGVVTGILGLFFTEWSPQRAARPPAPALTGRGTGHGSSARFTFSALRGGAHVGLAGEL